MLYMIFQYGLETDPADSNQFRSHTEKVINLYWMDITPIVQKKF